MSGPEALVAAVIVLSVAATVIAWFVWGKRAYNDYARELREHRERQHRSCTEKLAGSLQNETEYKDKLKKLKAEVYFLEEHANDPTMSWNAAPPEATQPIRRIHPAEGE